GVARFGQRLAEQLPGRRVIAVVGDRGPQVLSRAGRLPRVEVVQPEAEAQQRVVLALREQGLEAFGGIHVVLSRYHRPTTTGRDNPCRACSMPRRRFSRSPSFPPPTPRKSAKSPSGCRRRSPRSIRTTTT